MIRPHFRKRNVLILLTIVTLLPVFIGGFVLWHWANDPVEVTTTTVLIPPPSAVVAPQVVRSSCYSFQVPGEFKIRSVPDPANPNFIHTQAFEAASTGRQAGVTCNVLPSDGLPGVADYHLRASITQEYEAYDPGDMPPGSHAFRNIETGEISVFMVHGKRYASIAVTGVSGNNRLRSLCSQIYSSWQWL